MIMSYTSSIQSTFSALLIAHKSILSKMVEMSARLIQNAVSGSLEQPKKNGPLRV